MVAEYAVPEVALASETVVTLRGGAVTGVTVIEPLPERVVSAELVAVMVSPTLAVTDGA
jgi:hypothetical protein